MQAILSVSAWRRASLSSSKAWGRQKGKVKGGFVGGFNEHGGGAVESQQPGPDTRSVMGVLLALLLQLVGSDGRQAGAKAGKRKRREHH